MSDETTSARILRVRETLGLSQREFAKELGVTPGALAHWEVGRREVPGPILRLVALYEQQLHIPSPGTPTEAVAPRRASFLERSWLARTTSVGYAGAVWAALHRAPARPGATAFELKVRAAAGAHYVRTLGNLKGLGMKLGQILANFDALDPSLAEQHRAPLRASVLQASPMDQLDLLEVFLEDLGKTPRELFEEWSTAPIFAASIGQVHRAKLKSGEDVAVKVQYPRIVDTIRTDLRSVELLDRLYCALNPGQRAGIYAELRDRISEECDYLNEAENMRHFDRYFTGRKDIHIPAVFDAYSRRRVLTTEYVAGRSLEEFAVRADEGPRAKAAKAIWDFFLTPSKTAGIFHADPHSGNLILRDDGRVTFLDHGRVVRMSRSFIDLWREVIRAVGEKDRRRALELFARLDFSNTADALDSDDAYRLLVVNQVPWLWEGPFTFTTEFVHASWRALVDTRARLSLNVPRDAVLWNQLIFGVFALLLPLHAPIDCRESVLRILYGPDERRPPPYTHADFVKLGLIF